MTSESRALFGVDFTSAPSRRKPITAAHGFLEDTTVRLDRLEYLTGWPAFEALLLQPGPWLGAFDFPFGLPREGVQALGWPEDWCGLVDHCQALGKPAFRASLDADRVARPAGARYPHRATDRPARSHSPFKLVNPPVGLMFLEGAPRLLAAGVLIPGLCEGDAGRIALEAYPGLLARAVERASYKSDERRKQTPEREAARHRILAALLAGDHPLALRLECDVPTRERLVADASGDSLDAVLALVQAAWAWQRRAQHFGLPETMDPVEGWILGA
jgi:hypothetical protein